MLKKISRILRMHRIFIVQELKKQMEYKVDFIIGISAFFLVQLATVMFISIIFGNIKDLGGWTYSQILFIYGFSLIPKGLDHIFFDRLWGIGHWVVRKGEFDIYLTRPINTLVHVLMEQFQIDGIGELLVGIILVISTAPSCGIEWSVLKVILGVLVIPFAMLIYTALKTATAALAFWIKRSGNITFMFYMVNDASKYPISIYNKSVQVIITYIIPFALTAFYPASYILTGKDPLFCIGVPILVSIVMMAIGVIIWNRGLRAYESAGS